MKIRFTGSHLLTNKVIAIYAVAMTAVAGGILLLPAQSPKPNVAYDLFKIGQTTADQTLVANGWKPTGYSCQAAIPTQMAHGFGSTVCGYSYVTASHNLITNAGIDWLACRMVSQIVAGPTMRCNSLDTWIALGNPGTCGSQAATDTTLYSASEISTSSLNRAIGTVAHLNGSATYTVAKSGGTVFAATGTVNGICLSGLFNAASGGALVFENNFSSTNMQNGDTLAVTWTVTL